MSKIEQLRAFYKQQYGYDVGESGAMVLDILERSGGKQTELIEAASKKIQASSHVFQTERPKVAFCYGLSQNLMWSLVAIMGMSLMGFFWSRQKQAEHTEAILRRYPNAEKFEILMRESEIVKNNGCTELVLRRPPKNGFATVGKHVRIDQAQNRVYVPLFYDN